MSKQLTAIISDWDTETQQMIEKLHQARDEQVRLYTVCGLFDDIFGSTQ